MHLGMAIIDPHNLHTIALSVVPISKVSTGNSLLKNTCSIGTNYGA